VKDIAVASEKFKVSKNTSLRVILFKVKMK